ncbi:unnamed protein product, partial [Didymodactylos carnosus]
MNYDALWMSQNEGYMGRQEDKQQLAALNDKFAYYTSKVMLMEADA